MSSYRPTIQKRSSNGNRYIHPFYLFSGCIIILLLISFFYQFSELSNSKIDAIETFDSSKLRGQRSSTVNNNLPVLSIQSNNHINHNLQAYSHFLESTVLLIICSHRQDYLKRALEKVIMYHPKSGIPIFISEDGYHGSMQEVIDDASNHLKTTAPSVNLTHVHHPYYNQPEPNGYHKLSKHFKWAINSAFQFQSTVENVIILEEDLIIAPDFYSYFAATSTLLNSDPSILAVSAWNDNGQNQFVKDETQLYRSDFFPGLGWMVNKRIWEEELSPNWPDAYWDDWLRYLIYISI